MSFPKDAISSIVASRSRLSSSWCFPSIRSLRNERYKKPRTFPGREPSTPGADVHARSPSSSEASRARRSLRLSGPRPEAGGSLLIGASMIRAARDLSSRFFASRFRGSPDERHGSRPHGEVVAVAVVVPDDVQLRNALVRRPDESAVLDLAIPVTKERLDVDRAVLPVPGGNLALSGGDCCDETSFLTQELPDLRKRQAISVRKRGLIE